VCINGICYWTDPALAETGVRIAFSERTGGVSREPYASLNLAGHVDDDPEAVDENRRRFLSAVGLAGLEGALVTAEQVHGSHIEQVTSADAGRGARTASGPLPIPATDALLTAETDVPLMLLYADCVPVVLAVPGVAVCVVHAGWRGALASLPGEAVRQISARGGVEPQDVVAYIGAHIRQCHYGVGDDVMAAFVDAFGPQVRGCTGGLDLSAAVRASLLGAGVESDRIAELDACTAERTDEFFSFRAEDGVTGRHCAMACIAGGRRS
jgi:YfiH family protein